MGFKRDEGFRSYYKKDLDLSQVFPKVNFISHRFIPDGLLPSIARFRLTG
jgi:hypothetical protein